MHFNDTPKLNAAGATFQSSFETSTPGCKTATGPNYAGCLRSGSPIPVYGSTTTPIPPIYADPLYLDDTSAKFATYPGCHYYGATRVKFNVSPAGTMNVWSKDSVGKSTGTNCGTFTAVGGYTATNIPVPTDQVIYASAGSATHQCLSGEIGDGLPLGTYSGSSTVSYTYDQTMLNNDQFCGQGNLYVEGNVQGRVTLAAENSIVVTGDIVLSNGINGTDLVGLVAGNSVEVYHPWVDTWVSTVVRRQDHLGLEGQPRRGRRLAAPLQRPVHGRQQPRLRHPDRRVDPDAAAQLLGAAVQPGQRRRHPPGARFHRPALARDRRPGLRGLHQAVQVRLAAQVLVAAVLPAVDEREVGSATHR